MLEISNWNKPLGFSWVKKKTDEIVSVFFIHILFKYILFKGYKWLISKGYSVFLPIRIREIQGKTK